MPFLRCKDDCGKQALYECTRCRAPLCEDATKPRLNKAEFTALEFLLALRAFDKDKKIVCGDCRHADAIASVQKIRKHKWPSNRFELALELNCMGLCRGGGYHNGKYYEPLHELSVSTMAQEWPRYAHDNNIMPENIEVACKLIPGRNGLFSRPAQAITTVVRGWNFYDCYSFGWHNRPIHSDMGYLPPPDGYNIVSVAIDVDSNFYTDQSYDGIEYETLIERNTSEYDDHERGLLTAMVRIHADILGIKHIGIANITP